MYLRVHIANRYHCSPHPPPPLNCFPAKVKVAVPGFFENAGGKTTQATPMTFHSLLIEMGVGT